MASNPATETGIKFELRPGDIELSSEGRIVVSNPEAAATLKAVLDAQKDGQERRWNIFCGIHLNYQCNVS